MAVTKIDLTRQATNSGAINANSQLINNVATPVSANDAASKSYVDATAQGLSIRSSCRVASTGANLTLSGTQTIDGVAVVVGDRVLVKDQTTPAQNGIYTVSAGAWSRSSDDTVLASGQFTFVELGTINGGGGYVITTDNPITTGTTAIVYTQFSGAGEITAGAGLNKSGNTLSIPATAVTNSMLAGSIDLTTKVTGALLIGNGGTGATTPTGATTNLLPTQTSNSGKVLSTDGAGNLSWITVGTAANFHRTTVSGSQNSSNKVFTIGNALGSGSDSIYLNGQLLNTSGATTGANDYYLSATTLTFDANITAPSSTDIIIVMGNY